MSSHETKFESALVWATVVHSEPVHAEDWVLIEVEYNPKPGCYTQTICTAQLFIKPPGFQNIQPQTTIHLHSIFIRRL